MLSRKWAVLLRRKMFDNARDEIEKKDPVVLDAIAQLIATERYPIVNRIMLFFLSLRPLMVMGPFCCMP